MIKGYPEQPIKVPRFEESAGFYTSKQRGEMMSKIKGKNTKPELMFRKALWKQGIKYRTGYKGLPGKPDVSNKTLKFVVFIDGEFWHGHNWEAKKLKIKSNRNFWIPKIERNMQRDRQNDLKLTEMGFEVFRFWQHQVQNDLSGCVNMVVDYVRTKKLAI